MEPDLATYNIMLKSCSVSKCAERAKALYSDMEAGAATTGLKLDVFTYTTAIHVHSINPFQHTKELRTMLPVQSLLLLLST